MKNKSESYNLLNHMPLIFEKNIGQQDGEVKYVLKQNGCTTFFTQSEVVSVFSKKIEQNNEEDINDIKSLKFNTDKYKDKNLYETSVLRMKLENLNKNLEILGQDELNCKGNYFKGSKEEWVTDVDLYEKIIYKDIYENIDLVYYSNEGNLEYDFILKPQANVEDIKISFEGIDNMDIDIDENLKIDIKDSSIYLLKPKTYQVIGNNNIEIKSEFIINENKVSFKIDKYDKSKTLIIDPILLYSTYIGGSNTDYGYGVAVDGNEIAYMTGWTWSINFPTTPNAYKTTLEDIADAFLVKIDTNLSGSSSLIYSTYIGGNSNDRGYGVSVDLDENTYITGMTQSGNFPTTPNAYQSIYQGNGDAFLIKIDTKLSGSSSLIYSTYIGGSDYDQGNGISVDSDKNVYITGGTYSNDFPTTPNAYQIMKNDSQDIFLSRIDTKLSGGISLIYSTYIGGSADEEGIGVAVDSNKNVYITGWTGSIDFPTTPNAYQATNQGDWDVFLSRIDTKLSGNSGLIYSTYLGGSTSEQGYGIAVDSNENAYITGWTNSSGFPTTVNAYQATNQGDWDVFLSRIDTKLSGNSGLIYSTYLGGSTSEQGYGIAVDSNENAYITGWTRSSDFPTTPNAYQGMYKGWYDAFLSRIDTKLSRNSSLIYSTYLGGSDVEEGRGVAVDKNKNVYIAGRTSSSDFPTTPNAYQPRYQMDGDAFLVKMLTQDPFINLQMNKVTSPQFADLGTTITYTITLNNNGNVSANNIIFIDTIPNGTIFIPNSLNINGITVPQSPAPPSGINIGSINAGNTSTVTFKVKVDIIPTPNLIQNSATSTYNYTLLITMPDGKNGSSNSNIATTQINNGDIDIIKSSDLSFAKEGESLKYTILFKNIGNVTAENISFIDTIPTETTFIPDSVILDGITLPGQNPQLGVNVGSIAPNNSSIVTFKVSVDSSPSVSLISNSATATYTYTVDPSIINGVSKIVNSNIAITELTSIPIQTTILNAAQVYFEYTVNPSIPITVVNTASSQEVKNFLSAAIINIKLVTNENYGYCGNIIKYIATIINYGNIDAIETIYLDTIPDKMEFINDSFTINSVTIPGANPNTGVNLTTISSGSTTTVTYDVVIRC